jgi:hydrogenase/urease accessory protein HupE
MSRLTRGLIVTATAMLSVLLSAPAAAHEMTMAEMELREVTSGEFLTQWLAAEQPPGDELSLSWPDGCSSELGVLRCDAGLAGTLAIEGVGKSFSAALLRVFWLDGQRSVYTLTAAQPSAQLYGSADDRRGLSEIARAYTVLGVEHILTGFDHLLFVLALLFLVGFNRRLLYTITAFTAAHSLTLALAALGLLTLRSPPVEATIALSIVLVAGEALDKRPTLARRWPALVAFGFGLVHGLGFAGALQDIGLPQNHLSAALLTFNVGVELGQLLVVGVAYVAYRALAGSPRFVAARTPALYGIGTVAAYWSIGRVVAILA